MISAAIAERARPVVTNPLQQNLQNQIVYTLVDAYIQNRVIKPRAYARQLQPYYPELQPDQLTDAVARVAQGIGLRVMK